MKKILLNIRFINNIRNYIRTKKILSAPTGQMDLKSDRGALVYNFISGNEIENVLDIGTWNGLGSTTVLYEGLKSKKKRFEITSIETDKIAYKNALKNLKGKAEITLILGRIIDVEELPDIKSIEFEKHGLIPENIEWFYQDIRRYKKTKNILSTLNQSFDFILFDGGEFSTFAEFKKLYKRTKYFALDDVDTYKQYEVLNYIDKYSYKFELITHTDGLSIYKNIN